MASVSREELEKEGGAVLRELFRLLQQHDIQAAQAELDVDTGEWAVEITFKDGYRWRHGWDRATLMRGPEGWRDDLQRLSGRLVDRLTAKREEAAANVPLLTEHVVGFRQWKIEGNNLLPIGYGTGTWNRGEEVRAICSQAVKSNGGEVLHPPEEIPSASCECGLYAYHAYRNLTTTISKDGRVAGMVIARGAIQVYRDGFRSEYAKPVLLFWNDAADGPVIREVAAKLGIDSVPAQDIEKVIPRYGAPLPEQLLPQEQDLWVDVDL